MTVVVYKRAQVVKAGRFRLQEQELRQLWEVIEAQNFFALTDDYRMQIGSAYAFVMVEAEGRKHQVFNIGMEVPEMRALVEAAERVLPEGVNVEYGAGFKPQEAREYSRRDIS